VLIRSRGRRGTSRSRGRGQSLVEFALVAPIMIAVIGAIVQFGVVFWAQNTLTQVVRDTGRWSATHFQSTGDCTAPSSVTAVVSQANAIASHSSLMGYTSWGTAATPANPGVNVQILVDSTPGAKCPPVDNGSVDYVQVSIRHRVPTFFPGMEYLPLLGSCSPAPCHVDISSTAQFRMEPKP
jgi:Tfp pilus assembly protein PilW